MHVYKILQILKHISACKLLKRHTFLQMYVAGIPNFQTDEFENKDEASNMLNVQPLNFNSNSIKNSYICSIEKGQKFVVLQRKEEQSLTSLFLENYMETYKHAY